MPFKLNENVFVVPLKKAGVITEVGEKYQVQVGALRIQCSEEMLSYEVPKKSSTNEVESYIVKRRYKDKISAFKRGAAPTKLDLHGYTVKDAILALEDAINECILAGGHSLEVIHGLGSGKVKSAVLRKLAEMDCVKNYKVAEGNPGSTWAYF